MVVILCTGNPCRFLLRRAWTSAAVVKVWSVVLVGYTKHLMVSYIGLTLLGFRCFDRHPPVILRTYINALLIFLSHVSVCCSGHRMVHVHEWESNWSTWLRLEGTIVQKTISLIKCSYSDTIREHLVLQSECWSGSQKENSDPSADRNSFCRQAAHTL